jgi:hypothetical protein
MGTIIKSIHVRELSSEESKNFKNVKRVIKINNQPIFKDLFIDHVDRLCYESGNTLFRYKISRFNSQTIVIDRVSYELWPNSFGINTEVTKAPIETPKVFLDEVTHGSLYRLVNDVKVYIVDEINDKEFFEVRTFIGIYKGGTIRLNKHGKVLSHGGDKNWNVKEEWKENFIWIVTVKDGTVINSLHHFKEQDADQYINSIKSSKTLIFLAKTKVQI